MVWKVILWISLSFFLISCSNVKDEGLKNKSFYIENFKRYRMNKPMKAKDFLDTLLNNFEVDPSYYNQRGWLNMELGNYDLAKRDFTIAIVEVDSSYLVNRSNAFVYEGKIDSARIDIENYLSFSRDTGSYFFNKGMMYFNAKKYNESSIAFKESEEYSTYELESIAMQGRIYAIKGDTVLSCSLFSKLLSKDSNYRKDIEDDLILLNCQL